jgi:hypothetical protein
MMLSSFLAHHLFVFCFISLALVIIMIGIQDFNRTLYSFDLMVKFLAKLYEARVQGQER